MFALSLKPIEGIASCEASAVRRRAPPYIKDRRQCNRPNQLRRSRTRRLKEKEAEFSRSRLMPKLMGHQPHHLASSEEFYKRYRVGEPVAPVCQRMDVFDVDCFGGHQFVERLDGALMRALKKS